jgi:hypothetical protein
MKNKYFLLVAIAFLGTSLFAQTTVWVGAGDNAKWSDAANWRDALYPTLEVKTVFNADNATDCVIDIDSAKVKQLVIGDNTSYMATVIVKDGGVLTCGPEGSTAWSTVGYNKSGEMIIESGGVVNSVHRFHVGLTPPAAAEVVVLEVGGTLTAPKFTVNDPGNENWDASCFVTLGGMINTNQFYIGTGGLVDVSGGTITVTPAVGTAKAAKAAIDAYVTSGQLTAEGGDEPATIEMDADSVIMITSSTTVGIAPKRATQSTIGVYPNPATDVVYLNNRIADVEIYSITGQVVLRQKNVSQVNVEGLNPGYYMVKAKSDNKIYVDKLIIK